MTYLIEINVPREGWQAFKISQGKPLNDVLTAVRALYPGEEIHDIRVKRLSRRQDIIGVMRAVSRYWRPKQKQLWENHDA